MANQVALRALSRPGDDVIVSRESHAVWHEAGAGAANAGVQFTEIGGADGLFTVDDFLAARKPHGHMLFPATTLVEVENTQNRAGGVVWPLDELERIGAAAQANDVHSYLDGARLLNAAVARGDQPAALAAPFELVSLALSKGLGCPVGSLLAGPTEVIGALVRHRRVLGGAMRQSGILAAAGIYALEHNVARLADDHANARAIAQSVARSPRVLLDPDSVETNIVVFRLREGAPDAAAVVDRARELGVLVIAFGPRMVRAVTHLDVDAEACGRAGDLLYEAVETAA
jgi:threonine aldolase